MLYALRKLIAFVFLGGIFTYIYCDFGHLWDPNLGNSLFALVLLFAAIWLVVPPAVVYFRARARKARNRKGYEEWKKNRVEGGRWKVGQRRDNSFVHLNLQPQPHLRLDLEPGEHIYFVEKATLYADSPEGFGEGMKPGRVGDVAFPSLGGKWFKHQRVRIWITNHRVRFTGKGIDLSIKPDDFHVHTGGIVFTVKGPPRRRFAFVLKNPLITSEILNECLKA